MAGEDLIFNVGLKEDDSIQEVINHLMVAMKELQLGTIRLYRN